MHSQIRQYVETVWDRHLGAILEALDESSRGLQNLLRLDEYHRHGHEAPQLEETLGSYGTRTLNLSALSEILGQSGSSRGYSERRLDRIQRLVDRITELQDKYAERPGELPGAGLEEGEEDLHAKAEEHLNDVAAIFASLRAAQLEIHSKYKEEEHDSFFRDFTWRSLTPAELALCPPYIIDSRLESEAGPTLRKVMSLLESRKPFKILVMRDSLRRTYSPTADPSVPATLAIETIPLAMRGIFFLQSCPAVPGFEDSLRRALKSPRPGLISLLEQRQEESDDAFLDRARRTIQSRAFPPVVYDPDRAPGFVTCFELPLAPETEEPISFAEFAASESDFAREFSDPPENISAQDLIPVDEYLRLNRRQRAGKWPCLYEADDREQAHPKIVSQNVVTQMSDQIHLWKTLQEVSGVNNPHVTETRDALHAQMDAQQKSLIDSMKEEMERNQAHREKVAVANAVRQIVIHFTGVEPDALTLEAILGKTSD